MLAGVEANDLGVIAAAEGADSGLADSGGTFEDLLDGPDFDAMAADFYLPVAATHVLNRVVAAHKGEITCAVPPKCLRIARRRDKSCAVEFGLKRDGQTGAADDDL